MKKLWCRILGHQPTKLNVKEMTAICRRCQAVLVVSYDMAYGCTIVEGVKHA